MKTLSLCTLFFLLIAFKSEATCTYTAVQNGDWGNPSTWQKTNCAAGSPSIPSNYSEIIIPSSITVTVNNMYPLNGVGILVYGHLFFISGKKIELDCNSYLDIPPGGYLSGESNGAKIGFCGDWVWSGSTSESGPYSIGILPLPITLSTFNISESENTSGIDLYWSTSSEQNNAYFEILHSYDALSWDYVGKIMGVGNSQVETRYSYHFPTEQKGIHYFRLKQTDTDGKATSSEIKSILFQYATETEIYPNPANQITTLQFDKANNRQIQLFNTAGVLLENLESSEDMYHLQTAPYENGIYLLFIDGAFFTKLIIQH